MSATMLRAQKARQTKNLVHSSPKRQLNFATASEAAVGGELFFHSYLHNTAAGTLGMCCFIELICEKLPLESSSKALTGNDTLSLAVSNSGGATRNPCIFRPSKAFFPLWSLRRRRRRDPIPSLYRSSASREMEGEKLSLRPRPSFLPSDPSSTQGPVMLGSSKSSKGPKVRCGSL